MDPVTTYTSCRLRDSAGAIVPYAAAWWRGSPALWRIAVINPDGSLNDLSGIAKITLTLTDMVNGGPGRILWLHREYSASTLNPALTMEEWKAREAWHFEAALDGHDTLMTVPGVTSDYWALLEAELTGGELIPLAALQITLRSTRGTTLDRTSEGYAGALTFGGIPLIFGTDG